VKYRHAFHAGNFADVTKNVALVACLLRLMEKDRPIFLLDTHAGRGRYDIGGPGGEASGGIGRVLGAKAPAHPALVRYLGLVQGLNPDGALRAYPGSPHIAAAMMRAGDRAAFCELQPTEAEALRREFRASACTPATGSRRSPPSSRRARSAASPWSTRRTRRPRPISRA
jgi:23S rRNA (adenine2030-N6)-methyltransferase